MTDDAEESEAGQMMEQKRAKRACRTVQKKISDLIRDCWAVQNAASDKRPRYGHSPARHLEDTCSALSHARTSLVSECSRQKR